jgi:hypothetical protein
MISTVAKGRSYLIERPSCLAGHRVSPIKKGPGAFLENLRASGADLVWEEGRGFCLFWSLPHQPLIEAHQIDLIRASYEMLLRHFEAKNIPPATPQSEDSIFCWYAIQEAYPPKVTSAGWVVAMKKLPRWRPPYRYDIYEIWSEVMSLPAVGDLRAQELYLKARDLAILTKESLSELIWALATFQPDKNLESLFKESPSKKKAQLSWGLR